MDSEEEREQEELVDALFAGCEAGDTHTVLDLIQQGVDVNVVQNKHADPGQRRGLMEAESLIEEKNNGLTPLLVSTMYGHVALVEILMSNGAQHNVTDNGRSVLHYSATLDEPEGIELLQYFLEKDCDINIPDNEGNTPLIWAVNHNQIELVKFLLENGASVNASVTQFGYTTLIESLHVAFCMKLPVDEASELLEMFLTKGADVNGVDNLGNTPLHWAAQFNMLEMTRYLLSKGADAEINNAEGKKACELSDDTDIKSCFLTSL